MKLVRYSLEYSEKQLPALVKESSVTYSEDALDTPQKISDMLNDVYHLSKKTEEYLYLIGLDSASVPVGIFEVSHGVIDSSFSNPREIFQRLLLSNAGMFVLAHNHPSGNPFPSGDDSLNFHRIYEASKIMGVSMVDFLILGSLGSYCSFRENNYL